MAKGLAFMAFAAGLLAACLTGCSPFGSSAFSCERDDQCNSKGGGRCESNGFCSYMDPDCPGGQRYGDQAGGNSGRCVGDELPPDAPPDTPPDTPPGAVCYGDMTGLARPCFMPAPSGDLTLPATINTMNDQLCVTDAMGVPADAYCVIARANITVPATGTVVTGPRPLVLVATGTITVAGALDAASRHQSTPPYNSTRAGAGSDPAGGCSAGTAPGNSGGGAGGTFMVAGGDGGGGFNGGTGGIAGTAQPLGLRGGCAGQTGKNDAGGIAGAGGRGGGALYLIASTIDIAAAGQINASGEGGGRSTAGTNAAGGGGGSGGLIGLDAPTINNAGLVFANGGGGGEGGGGGQDGLPGFDPLGVAAAQGGSSGGAGGDGGAGGAGAAATSAGGPGTTDADDGGGGGGGGAGVIKLYSGGTLGGMRSPDPS